MWPYKGNEFGDPNSNQYLYEQRHPIEYSSGQLIFPGNHGLSVSLEPHGYHENQPTGAPNYSQSYQDFANSDSAMNAKSSPDPVVQAAELKKKLLQSKMLGSSSTSRATSLAPQLSSPTSTPARGYVPHALPQPPTQHSVPAMSADIDALIKAHSKPEQVKASTAAAGPSQPQKIPGIANNTINTTAAQTKTSAGGLSPEDGEITSGSHKHHADDALGRLGNYTVTKGKMSTSPTSSIPTVQHTTVDATPKEANGGSGKVAKTASSELLKLLENDAEDLHEWLKLTGYFDQQARKKKLERSRKMAEVEAEERRIKAQEEKIKADHERLAAERRKLMEEDRNEAFLNSMAAQTPQPVAAELQTRSTTNVGDKPVPTGPKQTPPKKRSDEDKDGQTVKRGEKAPNLDNRAPASDNYRGADRGQNGDRARDKDKDVEMKDADTGPSYRRSRSKQRDYGGHPGRSLVRRSASPPTHRGPRHGDDDDNDEYGGRGYRYDSYRGDEAYGDAHRGGRGGRGGSGKRGGWLRSPSPRHGYRHPKPIDLGGPGESRYFMVKSFNEDNVRQCMEDGIWTTQLQNAEVFANAFAHCKNVILFFSVNKSKAFQGYARMASPPSSDTPPPKWMNIIHWETTPPFRVEWLSTVEIHFRHVGHLKNSLNEGAAVLIGKDGQEIDEDCGRRLVREMEGLIRDMNSGDNTYSHHNGALDAARSYRGRGGYRGGRGGKHASIKREHDDGRWP